MMIYKSLLQVNRDNVKLNGDFRDNNLVPDKDGYLVQNFIGREKTKTEEFNESFQPLKDVIGQNLCNRLTTIVELLPNITNNQMDEIEVHIRERMDCVDANLSAVFNQPLNNPNN